MKQTPHDSPEHISANLARTAAGPGKKHNGLGRAQTAASRATSPSADIEARLMLLAIAKRLPASFVGVEFSLQDEEVNHKMVKTAYCPHLIFRDITGEHHRLVVESDEFAWDKIPDETVALLTGNSIMDVDAGVWTGWLLETLPEADEIYRLCDYLYATNGETIHRLDTLLPRT